MLNLGVLEIRHGVKDLTGLEYALNLTDLYLREGALTDLSRLALLSRLQLIDLTGNQIADVTPLAGLTKLTWLGLSNNRIVSVRPLAGLTKLTHLFLNGNQISDLRPLAGLTELTSLNIEANTIVDLSPLSGLTKLTILKAGYNEISNIGPLATLTELTDLDLNDNQQARITDISPLAGLTRLTRLDLGYHPISDISPLTRLVNITWLNLSCDRVSDIRALSGMTELKVLYLHGNQVTDLSPLAGLKHLENVTLGGNPLDAKACAVYIPRIKLNNPGLQISYDACLGKVYTLTVSATAGGAVPKPGEGAFICNEGESVPIEAVAKAGYEFTRWAGTAVEAGKVAQPETRSSTVVVNADYTLIANFRASSSTPPSPPTPPAPPSPAGNRIEGFEQASFAAGWSSSGALPWIITFEGKHSGQSSARAGAIGDKEVTSLTLKATVVAGRISFWRKISSEKGCDVYRFWIDDQPQEVLSGEYDWKEVSFPVTAGSHTFVWEYRKDIADSAGADTVYLDDVSIPPAP